MNAEANGWMGHEGGGFARRVLALAHPHYMYIKLYSCSPEFSKSFVIRWDLRTTNIIPGGTQEKEMVGLRIRLAWTCYSSEAKLSKVGCCWLRSSAIRPLWTTSILRSRQRCSAAATQRVMGYRARELGEEWELPDIKSIPIYLPFHSLSLPLPPPLSLLDVAFLNDTLSMCREFSLK